MIIKSLVFIILMILIFKLARSLKHKKHRPSRKSDEKITFEKNMTDQLHPLESISIFSVPHPNRVKPYFTEEQYHNDYKDILNAFMDISPNYRALFNRADMPIRTSIPDPDYVEDLVNKFIIDVNKNVARQSNSEVSLSGWKKYDLVKSGKSGWDKQQEALGLPVSVYNDPSPRAPIYLIKIDHVEKYETEYEMKLVCYLIIQKFGVKDQIIIRVSFITSTNDINNDRDFFKKDDAHPIDIKVEQIFMLGTLTDHSYGKVSDRRKFYNFEAAEKEGIFDEKIIIKELNKKRKQYLAELI